MDKKLKYYFFIVLVLIFGFSISCKNKNIQKKIDLTIIKQLNFDSTENTIVIANNTNFPVYFHLKINDIFPLEMEDIISQVEDLADSIEVDYDIAAWEYVCENTFLKENFTSEPWLHNPTIFLNSIGGGLCGNTAAVLAALWENWYDSVRVVCLEGHVVSEVKKSKKWQMFDPAYNIAYKSNQGEIYSVKELENSPEVISSPEAENILGDNPFLRTANPYAKKISRLYQTKDDNYDITEWSLNFQEYSDTFCLPAKTKLEINKINNSYQLSVILSPGSKGKLQLPFVPYSATGKFCYNFKNQSNQVNSENFYFPKSDFLNSIYIENVNQETKINYLVNPKLNFWKDENYVYLKASGSLDILITKKHDLEEINYAQIEYFYDQAIKNYSEDIISWSNIDTSNINLNFLQKNFKIFLDQDKRLTSTEKEKKMKTLNHILAEYIENNKESKKIKNFLNANYPKSLFILFLSIKYDKTEYIDLILQDLSST